MKQSAMNKIMGLCREARRHKDLEVRSAILDDIVKLIDEVDKDKGGALESAFPDLERK